MRDFAFGKSKNLICCLSVFKKKKGMKGQKEKRKRRKKLGNPAHSRMKILCVIMSHGTCDQELLSKIGSEAIMQYQPKLFKNLPITLALGTYFNNLNNQVCLNSMAVCYLIFYYYKELSYDDRFGVKQIIVLNNDGEMYLLIWKMFGRKL